MEIKVCKKAVLEYEVDNKNQRLMLNTGADLEVQLVQLNHCDGVYSN